MAKQGEHGISWTNETWTPFAFYNELTGERGWFCVHASAGCENCYAERLNMRLGNKLEYKAQNERHVRIESINLRQPIQWTKPKMIFVCSMTDLFADFFTDEQIDEVFAVMALADQHRFQVLTKRARRMRDYLNSVETRFRIANHIVGQCSKDKLYELAVGQNRELLSYSETDKDFVNIWPLPNVWVGISCEDQKTADERIPFLIDTPASVRWVSAEPLLGPLNLENYLYSRFESGGARHMYNKLDWVVVGGESGSGARAMHPRWARELLRECEAAGVAFHFKQHGEWLHESQTEENLWREMMEADKIRTHVVKHEEFGGYSCRIGKRRAGRLLYGVEHNGYPRTTTDAA